VTLEEGEVEVIRKRVGLRRITETTIGRRRWEVNGGRLGDENDRKWKG